jgi:hypothetical protein
MIIEDATSWVCGKCGRRGYKEVVTVPLRIGLASKERVEGPDPRDGKPIVKAEGETDFDGTRPGWQRDGKDGISLHASRPGTVRESRENEMQCGSRFIAAYNSEHGTDYGAPQRGGNPPDLVFRSPSGLPDLEVEHTRVDWGEQEPYKELATAGQWERQFSDLGELRGRILGAIQAKACHYPNKETRARFILLLEAFPFVPEEVMDQLIAEETETLSNAGFKEIWYVERRMEPRVRRLV